MNKYVKLLHKILILLVRVFKKAILKAVRLHLKYVMDSQIVDFKIKESVRKVTSERETQIAN